MKSHKAIISLGANNDAEHSLRSMASLFRVWVKDVKESPTLTSPAIGMSKETPDFSNKMLELDTTLSATELNSLCKKAEMMCGNTIERRKRGIIKADADLLLCGSTKYHIRDWNHDYVKQLLKLLGCFFVFFFFTSIEIKAQQQNHDTPKDELSKAIEYFGSQKYHEALLLFIKLEKSHTLSTRFLAYKGVCQFKDEEYEDAIITLTPIIPLMEKYPPHERAIYSYSCGESYFQLGKYFEAIPHFMKAYEVALDYDKAEICYRLGFSEMKSGNENDAIKWFIEAEKMYDKTSVDSTTSAHREQSKRMLRYLQAQAIQLESTH